MSLIQNIKRAADNVGIKAVITNSNEKIETQLNRLTRQEDSPTLLISWDMDIVVEFDGNGFLKNPGVSIVCLLLSKPEDLTKEEAELIAEQMGKLFEDFLKELYSIQIPFSKDPSNIITSATYKLLPRYGLGKHSGILGRFIVANEISNCDG